MREIWLVRHGMTAWARDHRHTGRTDVPLLPEGEQAARDLGPRLQRDWAAVMSSPLQRAWRTAELAGLTSYQVDDDLAEWNYGAIDGRTTEEVSAERGSPWNIWADGVESAGGESLADVGRRATRVIARAAAYLAREQDVALVGHGHALRILAATWLGLPPASGALFALAPGSVSALGFEHGRHVLQRWNVRPGDVLGGPGE